MIRWIGWRGWLTTVAAAVGLAAAPSVAAAQVQPFGTSDYGGFRNILPPGANGLDTLSQLGAFQVTGARPAHNDDQLQMYSSLTTAAGAITAATLPNYFKTRPSACPAAPSARARAPSPG